MGLEIGQELCWVHGNHYRIGTVIELKDEDVKLSGLTSDYWIKIKSLENKLNKTYRKQSLGL